MVAKNFKQFDSDPWWTTQVRKRYGDLLVGIDQNVWMYRKVANGPVQDAVNSSKMLQVGESIDSAIAEVATLTGKTRTKRRSIDKNAYRHCHLLAINVPRAFTPPDIENRDYLARLYPDRQLRKRVVLFGVKLKAATGGTGGLQATMDSIKHTLLEGGTPMSDYDKDRLALDAALTRAGLHMPSPEDLQLANSWWNNGSHADVPYMPHGDHMHIFNSEAAARAAKRLHESEEFDSCGEWPDIAGEHNLSFSTVESFDMDYMLATDPRAHWGAMLLDQGAVAVSVRFMVEPSTITREELRRMKKNYRDDIAERYANGKMERAEQEEMLGRLTDVEAHYSGQGSAPPTLTDTSITVAVSGRDERTGFDPTEMGERAGTNMDSMLNRQEQAFIDTMMCSNIRSNPHLHDLPSTALAYAGLPDLSVAGDAPRERGSVALLGFSERDRQPMWMDAMAATDEDSVPICLVVGQSGSGKALQLSTIIETPSGKRLFGDLRVGDQVFDRHGNPCNVTALSPIHEKPEAYKITFDTGQSVTADADHQWIVSSAADRSLISHPHRHNALVTFDEAMEASAKLHRASLTKHNEFVGLDRLFMEVNRIVGKRFFANAEVVRAALKFCDHEPAYRTEVAEITRGGKHETSLPVVEYPTESVIDTYIESIDSMDVRNIARWGENNEVNRAAAVRVKSEVESDFISVPEFRELLISAGAILRPGRGFGDTLGSRLRQAGYESSKVNRLVEVERKEHSYTKRYEKPMWRLSDALETLSQRLTQRYPDRPSAEAAERVMSTLEMLNEGVVAQGKRGAHNFSTKLPLALQHSEKDLPIDPWLFGAWLGDGSSAAPVLAVGNADSEWTLAEGRKVYPDMVATFHPTDKDSGGYWTLKMPGMSKQLKKLGTLNQKHIPAIYATASIEQRLSVLQGLMDTDGTIGNSGNCELCLSDERLATDALSLIRSLGIKASMTSAAAGYRDSDGNYVECKDRYRIHFTTTEPVFRMPRKAERLPSEVRDTQSQLYITSIEPVDPVPMRCITVDSPDHSYVVDSDGPVPTHNSVLMQWMADQYARTHNDRNEKTPVIMVDLKESALSLTTPIPMADGSWTTMEDVQAGDRIVGGDGLPCTVLNKSDVWDGETTPMYRLVLDDKRHLDASHHHRWKVSTFNSRQRARHDKSGKTSPWVVLTTQQMVDGVDGGRYQLPISGAVNLPERDLLVDPYILGAWLGDGFSHRGAICTGYEDLDAMTALLSERWGGTIWQNTKLPQSAQITLGCRDGECFYGHQNYVLTIRGSIQCGDCPVDRTALPLVNPALGVALARIGVLHNKSIPEDYMNASFGQRMELLRGLMDTDGTCHNKTGRCSFSSTRRDLAVQVLRLVRSLGIKAFLNYVPQNESYAVTFKTDLTVFNLERKAVRQDTGPKSPRAKAAGHRATVNIVESIERIGPEDSQCIMVDSPDHTFVAGDYVVTHNSDFTPSVQLTDGKCFTLSDLINNGADDGVFDAIRFSITPQAGIDRAHTLIMQVNPFGSNRQDYETPLRQALSYGVDNGAACTGQALEMAAAANVNPEIHDILTRVKAAATSPIFKAICGFNPNSPGLRVSGGTTYIRIGDMSLDLPSPGSTPDEQTQMQRTWLALVKAMIYGSISALANRQGVVLFDEGWIFLGSGRAEMEAMGRLARSQQVFPIIFTQRTQDALKAELEGYISRGVILPIEDPKEAAAALKLFKLEATNERMTRITGKATRGDAGAERGAPNWNSFRALRDPKTKKVVRGTIGLYVDLAGNAVPTEIALSPTFLLEASTNREDMAKRAQEAEFRATAEAEARQGW